MSHKKKIVERIFDFLIQVLSESLSKIRRVLIWEQINPQLSTLGLLNLLSRTKY